MCAGGQVQTWYYRAVDCFGKILSGEQRLERAKRVRALGPKSGACAAYQSVTLLLLRAATENAIKTHTSS